MTFVSIFSRQEIEKLQNEQQLRKKSSSTSSQPCNYYLRKVRFVCISDTHTEHDRLPYIPSGDVLIHCGDFANRHRGTEQITTFNNWFKQFPHPVKIVISGNQEYVFNTTHPQDIRKNLLPDCTYLQDSSCVIRVNATQPLNNNNNNEENNSENNNENNTTNNENILSAININVIEPHDQNIDQQSYLELMKDKNNGIVIHGSPWTTSRNMAFSCKSSAIGYRWNKIPNETDILLTHLPPYGILDFARNGANWGCPRLRKCVKHKVQPRVHVFGHVHEGYGSESHRLKDISIGGQITGIHNGMTFINAASKGQASYRGGGLRVPIVFDYYLLVKE